MNIRIRVCDSLTLLDALIIWRQKTLRFMSKIGAIFILNDMLSNFFFINILLLVS